MGERVKVGVFDSGIGGRSIFAVKKSEYMRRITIWWQGWHTVRWRGVA